MRDTSCKLSWAKDKPAGLCYVEDDARESVLVRRLQLTVNLACFCWAWEICEMVTPPSSWKITRGPKIFAEFNLAKYLSNVRRSDITYILHLTITTRCIFAIVGTFSSYNKTNALHQGYQMREEIILESPLTLDKSARYFKWTSRMFDVILTTFPDFLWTF